MKEYDIIYCSLLGICNFFIFRELSAYGIRRSLLQGFANPRMRKAVFGGILLTLAGGIAHRTINFNPDVSSPLNWALVFLIPLILAFIFKTKLDPGWVNLEKSKAIWMSLYPGLIYKDGVLSANASNFASHPKVIEAKALIKSAIELSPQSNRNPLSALANKAIAWHELGFLYRVVNEFEEAERALLKAINILNEADGILATDKTILSTYSIVAFRMGELNHIKGNINEARKWYNISLSIDSKLSDTHGEQVTKELLKKIDA